MGNMDGRSFPRAFDRWVKFLFYQENVYEDSRDIEKKALETLSIGAPVP